MQAIWIKNTTGCYSALSNGHALEVRRSGKGYNVFVNGTLVEKAFSMPEAKRTAEAAAAAPTKVREATRSTRKFTNSVPLLTALEMAKREGGVSADELASRLGTNLRRARTLLVELNKILGYGTEKRDGCTVVVAGPLS